MPSSLPREDAGGRSAQWRDVEQMLDENWKAKQTLPDVNRMRRKLFFIGTKHYSIPLLPLPHVCAVHLYSFIKIYYDERIKTGLWTFFGEAEGGDSARPQEQYLRKDFCAINEFPIAHISLSQCLTKALKHSRSSLKVFSISVCPRSS